jgi:hypothetical protein
MLQIYFECWTIIDRGAEGEEIREGGRRNKRRKKEMYGKIRKGGEKNM